MKHLLILISILLLSSPVIGQSGKPQTIIIPTGSLGEMSESRIKILEKTLESKLDDYFAIVPKELFEEAQEQAFEELEYDECTEDQCIRMIQELLQIENAFKMDLIFDEGDTQISITWNDQEQKRVEEDYCEGCKTKELRLMIGGLVEKLVGEKKVIEKPVVEVKKVEPEPEVVVVRNNDFNKYEKVYYKWSENGYIWSKNGDPKINNMYQGELLRGIPHGYGKLTFLVDIQMFTFIGEFRNGEKHGEGKQYYQNGKIKFEGIWKFDKFYNVTRYDKNGNIDGKNVNGKWNYFTPLKPTN